MNLKDKSITNIASNIFESIASTIFYRPIQSIINRAYVNLLGVDMSEFKKPDEYNSLNALFTRALEIERDVDQSSNTIISPTDSLISDYGHIDNRVAMQIKGMKYFIDELLTSKASHIKKIIDGDYINFYLSPKDYHRYHAPCDIVVTKLIHVPGKLYPVNMRYLTNKLNLFVENERVILECITNKKKIIYLVFVGALNVGKMVFNFENTLTTNSKQRDIKEYIYDNLTLKKGEEIGYFKMGSTVLLLAQKNTFDSNVKINQKVKFTDIVGHIK